MCSIYWLKKIYTSLVDDLLCIVHLICVVFFDKKFRYPIRKSLFLTKKEKDNLFVLIKQRKGQWRHTIGSTDEVE
jgi:hypothetical protein